MPINQSRADLRGQTDDGLRPDATPRFGVALAHAWHKKYQDDGLEIRAMAHEGVLFRASDAGNCARALGYKVRRRRNAILNELLAAGMGEGEPLEVDDYSNPPTLADSFRMGIGQMVHDAIEEVLPTAYPGAECEVVLRRSNEPGISMHVDVIVTEEDGTKTAIEIKTINGTGYKMAIGADRGGAKGPRQNAIVQGALAAHEADCDHLVVIYLALELLSPAVAKRYGFDDLGRFVAEWTFGREEIEAVAAAEHKRMAAIAGLVEEGTLPPRSIPDPEIPSGHRVTNPSTGDWQVIVDGQLVNVGSTWHCAYCWDQDRCVADLKAGL